MGGLYLVWLLLCGASTDPPSVKAHGIPRKLRRRLPRMLPRLLLDNLPRRLSCRGQSRHLSLMTRARRRPGGGWHRALQLRLRLRYRADYLARRIPSLFLPSITRRSVHTGSFSATYTSISPLATFVSLRYGGTFRPSDSRATTRSSRRRSLPYRH
jgi:hypothetical protein